MVMRLVTKEVRSNVVISEEEIKGIMKRRKRIMLYQRRQGFALYFLRVMMA